MYFFYSDTHIFFVNNKFIVDKDMIRIYIVFILNKEKNYANVFYRP